MRLTPRRDEVAEIAALLDEAHESAEAAAKAVLKLCADLLQDRDLVALVLTDTAGGSMNIGPFGNEAEAKSFADKLAPAMDTMHVASLVAPGPLLAAMGEKKNVKGHCESCGLSQWAHELAGTSRGKAVLPGSGCTGWKAL